MNLYWKKRWFRYQVQSNSINQRIDFKFEQLSAEISSINLIEMWTNEKSAMNLNWKKI